MNNKSFPGVSNNFHKRVMSTLNSLPEKKENVAMYKKLKIKRGIIAAAAAMLLLGSAVFASNKAGQIFGWSSSKPDYTSIPSVTECEKQIDARPNIIKEFTNGYTFCDGNVIHDRDESEDGDKNTAFNSVCLRFENNGKSADIYMRKSGIIPEEYNTKPSYSYDGTELYFSEQGMKFVPSDYKLTGQDLSDEASGKYVFSYGTDEIEVHHYKNIVWDYNGVQYNIMCRDNDISGQELYNMAVEIINAG